ncbi:hypothetical protein U703_10195 [Rhodobacter capsulatus YW1]|nr:hypothetical protein U703_10195 [Rhodobacter capsulatus YW1]
MSLVTQSTTGIFFFVGMSYLQSAKRNLIKLYFVDFL